VSGEPLRPVRCARISEGVAVGCPSAVIRCSLTPLWVPFLIAEVSAAIVPRRNGRVVGPVSRSIRPSRDGQARLWARPSVGWRSYASRVRPGSTSSVRQPGKDCAGRGRRFKRPVRGTSLMRASGTSGAPVFRVDRRAGRTCLHSPDEQRGCLHAVKASFDSLLFGSSPRRASLDFGSG
jgi:hypothetical protein